MLRGLVSILCILAAASAPNRYGADASPPTGADGTWADHTEADRPEARPLPFFYDLYTFRGSAGSTVIVAAFAVSAGNLEEEYAERVVRYRFDVTLVLADTALRSLSRTDDSVFVAVPRPLAGEHLLHTHIEVQAPPSASTLQRVIMTDATKPGIGQLYGSAFPIPDYSGKHLMLSDIALGQPEAEAGWSRGDVTLALLPTSQFPGSSFDVYYEIYNLPADDPYSTEISVQPVDEAGAPIARTDPVRLRFSSEPAGHNGTLAELRRVDASLDKGRYRITVQVTDQRTSQSASKSRLFEVRGWGPATTLVSALPRGGK